MLAKPPGIPRKSGVYIFRGPATVLYVGKAKDLANRISSYFATGDNQSPKAHAIVAAATSLDWIITQNEVDALILENELIKKHQPRFNVRLKDDKTYPYLALDLRHDFPVPFVTRSPRQKGVRYFGPFGHVKSLRRMLDEVLYVAPLRTCSIGKFKSHERLGRPCLLFDLKKCSGPCVRAVSEEEYSADVDRFVEFFTGRIDKLRDALICEMNLASSERRYEDAARARDSLRALDVASTEQHIVLDSSSELDLISVSREGNRAVVTSVQVRSGRVVGRDNALFDIDTESTERDSIEMYCARRYVDPERVPAQVVIGASNVSYELLAGLLTRVRGRPVSVHGPRGDRQRAILKSAVEEGLSALRRDSLRRTADHNVRSQALIDVAEALQLPAPPFRIECFDMSHLHGTSYVGSMVVTVDGIPAKSAYRHFNIKTVWGNDDVGAMREVITRRLRYLVGDDDGGKFPRPDLIVIDGGIPQLNAALDAARDVGVIDVEFVALAKREELLFRPHCAEPIRLERGSEGLYLLQRIRDEAHRFAITFHRSKRGSAMVSTALDGVSGLGPARQKRLLAEFQSLTALRAATLDELTGLKWLPSDIARALYDHLHQEHQPRLVQREGLHDD